MVLESLINPFVLKKRPWEMFIAGFFYSVVALFLSYLVFREVSGLLMVFLIIMSTLPILYTTIKEEEEIDLKYHREWDMLREHSHVLFFLLALFLGITVALSLCYVFLPSGMVEVIFNLQNKAIYDININVLGNVTSFGLFQKIFFNNLKVLFFCLAFAFLYGAGAIFILTWNASVISAAIGSLIKTELAKTASLVGFNSIASYFSITTFSFMRYMTHGIFEIAAYFVAGLAGSIISIAVIKKNLDNDRVIFDATELIILSLAMLVIAAVIEVFITPNFF
ncbi:MAG: stage II sporulation protein M [Candidatus Woesearchaeota archaeon]